MSIEPTWKRVYQVNRVDLSILLSCPPQLHIWAKGEAASNGWTNPQLVPFIYIEPPADGIYDFEFVADPPQGPDNPVITPIEATYIWPDFPDWLKGVRVHSATNAIVARLEGAKQEKPARATAA